MAEKLIYRVRGILRVENQMRKAKKNKTRIELMLKRSLRDLLAFETRIQRSVRKPGGGFQSGP